MPVVVLAAFAAPAAFTPSAGAQAPTTTIAAPPPPPKAWILVDAGSGRVLDAGNEREPLRPASLTKLITALAVVARVPADAPVPVSVRAEGMPARKLNMKAGEVWDLEDALHSMLLSSANDAAFALAEKVAGTVEGFAKELDAVGRELRMADSPLLVDPSGLDDEFSVRGGNLISARDLAIAARAFLAEPRLAPIAATPVYTFTGGDGIVHRLGNHNRLLKTYPGAVGLKTGYTKRSGHCLIAAATRDGRTLIAVVLDAVDTYRAATGLLDRGFTAPRATGDVLPRVPAGLTAPDVAGPAAPVALTGRATGGRDDVAGSARTAAASSGAVQWWRAPATVAGAMAVIVGGLRTRVRVRRWRRRQRMRTARVRPAVRRAPDPALTTEFRPRPEDDHRFREVVARDGQLRPPRISDAV